LVDVADQLAELTWTAPTPPYDPTITGYTITASPADTPPVALDQATDILWFYLGHHAWRLLAAASAPVF
jgi:hypothetical protein